MKWINLLHIYQPVNADAHTIKEATEESYYRIIRALEDHPGIKFTVNINGCIFYRWEELGYTDLIRRIGKLVKKGQIELTGTACYHPLVPLIPEREARRQIKENEAVLQKYFGADFKPHGFFLPELAYSPEAAKLVKSLGYRWLMLDEMAVNGKTDNTNIGPVYKDKNSGLEVVVRSRKLSDSYVPETVAKLLDKGTPEENLLITATDAELYGLRHKDPQEIFEKLLTRKNLKTATVSEFIEQNISQIQEIRPKAHSWTTSEEEFNKGEPFNLWQNKTNIIQKELWKLANLAYNTIEEHPGDANHVWARWHFVRGLASCTFWWASAKDFLYIFGPISWSPDEIERGTNEFIRAIRALDDASSLDAKFKAEKMYIEIKRMIWKQHWTYHWKRNFKLS